MIKCTFSHFLLEYWVKGMLLTSKELRVYMLAFNNLIRAKKYPTTHFNQSLGKFLKITKKNYR